MIPLDLRKKWIQESSKMENMKKHDIIICPVCKSNNIADDSEYQSNGIIGPGRRSWKTSDIRSCNSCGVIFKPVKGNGL